ncbi:1, 4-beta cellobiohydrolase [Peziza echinospora]|nr:1, 4-beta cellobiohydrolase [Peziza echinospora]
MKSLLPSLLAAAMLLSPSLNALISASPYLHYPRALFNETIPGNGTAPGNGTSNGNDTVPCVNLKNPFQGRELYVNSGYATKLEETIKSFLEEGDKLNAARTRSVQKVSTFVWVSSTDNINGLIKDLDEAAALQRERPMKQYLFPFVVYNLPDRDCSAKASDGEFHLSDDGLTKYFDFIDTISLLLETPKYLNLRHAIVLEPDSLGNMVTNMDVPKCAGAAEAYIEGLAYAVAKLQKWNVDLYIDAAHSNWLGWPGNLEPAAKLFKEVLTRAGGNAKIRGFATNVSNYNAFNPKTADIIYGAGPDNPNWSELRYAQALAPYLEAEGLPAHFIIDQGRSGAQNIRTKGGHWCNIADSGFGLRPTSETGECIVDALVWVKPGGESDGTSDANATRFDVNCVSEDAKVPAPEAGFWFNEFVKDLVRNADPPLEPTYLEGPGGQNRTSKFKIKKTWWL